MAARQTLHVSIIATQIFALTHLIATYSFHVGPGSGPSMLPTLLQYDEWLLVNRHYRRGRDVKVGDCVEYIRPIENGGHAVKRVMGMPGDYVLRGSPNHLNESVAAGGNGKSNVMIQVPKGHVFLVGDNLDWSRDSRDYGPVSMGLIQGKVTHKISMEGWWIPGWFIKIGGGLQRPNDGH